MKSRHYRWLGILLATSIGGGIVAGCGDNDDWQHPNRVLYPAPPEATNDTMSVDELERAWRQQDLEAERAARRQQEESGADRPQHQPEASVSGSATIEAAIEYLEDVLGGVKGRTADVPVVDSQNTQESPKEPIGGGPPPAASSSSDSEPGEM